MPYWIHENDAQYPGGLLVHHENCEDREEPQALRENDRDRQAHGPYPDLNTLRTELATLSQATMLPNEPCGCMTGYYFCKTNNGPSGEVKVHASSCYDCRYGLGNKRGVAPTTRWYGPYPDTGAAFREARRYGEPRDCGHCNPTIKERESRNLTRNT